MKTHTQIINEGKYDVMTIPEAFRYCREKLGIRCRWETIIEDIYYEISPGLGNAAEYTFALEDNRSYGPVIYCPRGLRMPGKFIRDKSLQKSNTYFTKFLLGEERQYWRPTKEILDKLLDACLINK